MSETKEKRYYTILAEVFSLIAKYGEKDFIDSLEKLKDVSFINSLSSAADFQKKIEPIRERSNKKKSYSVKKDYHPKMDLIKEIKSALSDKHYFKGISDVKLFLFNQSYINPELLDKRNRQRLVNSFCLYCESLSTDKLKTLHGEVLMLLSDAPSKSIDDRSLEDWSNIILNKHSKKEAE